MQKRILIIEDDTALARGLKDLLRSDGYDAQISVDGRNAVREATVHHTDLVILDVNLPRLSGIEVCRKLRRSGFAKPILMLTARTEQIDKVIGLEAGADDYVTKPFDTHELLARVRAQLRVIDRLPGHGAPESGSRRLLSVMFTDMKGFARKMNVDEKLAMSLLQKHNALITRIVKRHGGKVIEVIGDAFMMSFVSALRAVQCGIAIQNGFRKLNTDKPGIEQVHVRIGIHLGDVMEENGKLRGDTINIAARLQQLGSPDHIDISESVLEAVRGKLHVKPVKIGKKRFKNIKQPVSVYRIAIPTTRPEVP